LAAPGAGTEATMIGLALALIVAGIVLVFFAGPFGFVVGIVGVVLLVAYAIGFGRRAKEGRA
jgi:4-hydroxybenzoate polyprenyltransferase